MTVQCCERAPQGARAKVALRRAVVVACIGAAGATLPARVDLFDELYRRGQEQNGDLKTFTASFVETTLSPLLTRPLVARGMVAVERPSRIALRYTEPDERVVLIDGDRMTVVWPSRNFRQVKDVGASQRRIQKYFVEGRPEDLRGHFTIAARESDEHGAAYVVTMVPRRKQIQEGLSRLELWVSGDSLLLTAMRMTFPTGDTKLMTFTDVVPNAPVDPTMFRERAGPAR